MNSAILSAVLTSQPQIRHTQNEQIPVMEFDVEFVGRDKQGQVQNKPLKVVVWNGNVAKVQQLNLVVGQALLFEGSISMDKVQTTDDKTRIVAKFWASRVIPMAADPGINLVNIAGRLGQEPNDDVRYFDSGNCVATNSVAVRRPKKGAEPDWFRFKVWNKTAESLVNHQHKGNTVGVTGRLDIEIYQDRSTGEIRHNPVVVGDRVSFLGGKTGESQQTAPVAAPTEATYDEIPF